MLNLLLLTLAQTNQTTPEIQTHKALALHDKARNKDLPLRITFPKAPGKYPVIVFSHGLGGSKDAMDPLVQPWAKAGYVVIQPTHEDSGVFAEPGARQRSRNQLIGNPLSRPADIKLILDNFAEIESKTPGLADKVDTAKIAMAGHSYGAWTTMAIGGLNANSPAARRADMADPRPLCLLAISPQGLGQSITAESYAPITRPTLAISGTEDTTPIDNQPAEWRKALFENQKPGDKYFLWIEGATHNFGGISGLRVSSTNQRNPQMVALVAESATAFFDAYLKNDPQAKTKLKQGQFKKEGTPAYEWKTK